MKKKIILVGNELSINSEGRLEAEKCNLNISNPISTFEDVISLEKKIEPDIFLVDLLISENEDCLEIVSQIKKAYDIPIIYLTSATPQERNIKNSVYDSYGFLRKPTCPETIKVAVEAALYKKEMLLTLKESRCTNNALLNASSHQAMVVDKQCKILAINNVMCEFLGSESNKLINRYCSNVIYPELLDERIKKIQEVFQTGKEVTFSDSYKGKFYRNHYFPVKNRMKKTFQVVIYIRDVTTSEVANDHVLKLSKVLETMLLGVVIVDMNMKIIYCNEAKAKMHSYQRSELIGKKADVFISEEFPQESVHDLLNLLRGVSRERMNIRKDGSLFPVRIISDAVIGNDGTPFAFVIMCEDISERKEMETQLLRSERLAGVGSLAAGIAHEIRNPLGNISSSAQFCLSKDDLQQDFKIFLEIIKRNADHANDIIKDLLDFANPREIKKYPINMISIINTAISLVESKFISNQIELITDFAEDLPLLELDEKWIEQSFQNVILNSIEAMPSGGEFQIRSYLENQQVVVSFKDNGSGIDEEDLNKIFDPFFTTKDNGVGLGLSSINYVLTAHDAKLKINSEIGEGTTFLFFFPINKSYL